MTVFLSCVKTKNDHECKAEEMYISPLFKKALTYAKTLNARKIYILSAKYGVLELDDVITPYNQTLLKMKSKERKEWGEMVKKQLEEKGTDFNEEVTFLCGSKYREQVEGLFENKSCPIDGLTMGRTLQFYDRNTPKEKVGFKFGNLK